HEDAMVDGLGAAEMERLVEDLRRRQISPKTHLARGAERAREGAAALRGDADRAPTVPEPHQYGLDGMPVPGSKQRLDRAVMRASFALELECRKWQLVGQSASERDRNVRHLFVPRRPAGGPAPDLPSPVAGLAVTFERRVQGREVHVCRIGT